MCGSARLTRRKLRGLLPSRAVVTGPVDTGPVTTDAFRACLEEVAADDGVDAMLAVVVPTAISDLSAAAAEAVISKPLAVAMLERAESVQRLKRLPVALPPAGWRADTRPAVGLTAVGATAAADEEAAAIIDEAAAAVTGVPGLRRPGGRGPRARPRGPLPGLAQPTARQDP